jgi:hypothetical protein
MLVREQPLRRRADLDIDVGVPETATKPRNEGIRPK